MYTAKLSLLQHFKSTYHVVFSTLAVSPLYVPGHLLHCTLNNLSSNVSLCSVRVGIHSPLLYLYFLIVCTHCPLLYLFVLGQLAHTVLFFTYVFEWMAHTPFLYLFVLGQLVYNVLFLPICL